MTNPKHTDTSRSGDLVAAMKDQLESWEFEDPRETWWKWQHQYAQAADLIETQAREIERLRDTPHHIWAEARDSEWDEGFNYAVKLFRAALAGDSHD